MFGSVKETKCGFRNYSNLNGPGEKKEKNGGKGETQHK